MKTVSRRAHDYAGRPKQRWLITGTFLLVTVCIVAIVGLNEQLVSLDNQALSELGVSAPPDELIELQAREDSLLAAAGAIDSAAGIYRIPVDRAIELIAAEESRQGR